MRGLPGRLRGTIVSNGSGLAKCSAPDVVSKAARPHAFLVMTPTLPGGNKQGPAFFQRARFHSNRPAVTVVSEPPRARSLDAVGKATYEAGIARPLHYDVSAEEERWIQRNVRCGGDHGCGGAGRGRPF
ncbi:hypothetical protein Are01nite_72590 [Actinoplanes regularis]|nr:hypothetical protein Are01nite_72590 [Actinoplanes regularis]